MLLRTEGRDTLCECNISAAIEIKVEVSLRSLNRKIA